MSQTDPSAMFFSQIDLQEFDETDEGPKGEDVILCASLGILPALHMACADLAPWCPGVQATLRGSSPCAARGKS